MSYEDDDYIFNTIQMDLERYGNSNSIDGFKATWQLRELLRDEGIYIDDDRLDKILGRQHGN